MSDITTTVILPRPVTGAELAEAVEKSIEGIYASFVKEVRSANSTIVWIGQFSKFAHEQFMVAPPGTPDIRLDDVYEKIEVRSFFWVGPGRSVFPIDGYDDTHSFKVVSDFAAKLSQYFS